MLNMVIGCGILGVIIGSFLNVVIYRLPRGESIVYPNSHCPKCGHFLNAVDLIPVISFLLRKGRCRYCRKPISWRYPLTEVLTGLVYAYAGWRFGANLPELIIILIFLALLIALSFIDIETFRLPDELVWPILGLGIFGAITGWLPLTIAESVLCAVSAGGSFWIIATLYPQGMGFGDVKLVSGLGAILGFPHIVWAIFVASFSGAAIGGFLLVLKKKRRRDPIPFGPYLAFGATAALFWGEQLSYWLF